MQVPTFVSHMLPQGPSPLQIHGKAGKTGYETAGKQLGQGVEQDGF